MQLTIDPVTYFRPRISGPELAIEDAVIQSMYDLFDLEGRPVWLGGSVPIGSGRPDIVSAWYDPRVTCLTDFSVADIHILAYLRTTQDVGTNAVAEALRYSHTTVNESFSALERSRIVARSLSGSFSICTSWRDILPEVITIEAKVSDWRCALQQAIRNTIFAHRSFVALPSSVIKRLDYSVGFATHGIGVLEVNDGGWVSICREARRNTPSVWNYYFRLAAIAARDIVQRSC